MKKLCILILFLVSVEVKSSTFILTSNINLDIKVKSWKELRDKNITKQDLDYSCGAASMATLLNGYFNQNVTEQQLLKIMNKQDLKASFADMQQTFKVLGFESKGYAVSFDTLKTIKIPVIVYVRHRKSDHFSVVKGINENFVQLADPSLGKITLSKEQFLNMWITRQDAIYQGKILAVIPATSQQVNTDFFLKNVKQPSVNSIRSLSNR